MKPASYRYEADGTFVIDGYNRSSLFSSFLPGIAGENGVPLWAFTVNRGQAVSSFGVRNKDGAIAEFFPADRAYQTVTLRGFRTFLKVKRGGKTAVHEPFQPTNDARILQTLRMRAHEVEVEETHPGLGLRVRAVMFTLPGAPLGALLRTVTVENLSSSAADVEFVDGLPLLLSAGLNQWCVKYMSRTMEAFAVAETAGAPFLRLKVLPADSEKVVPVDAGVFFAGQTAAGKSLTPLIDPRPVFGDREDFVRPEAFFDGVAAPKGQRTGNRNPAGLLTGKLKVAGKSAAVWHAVYGRAESAADMKSFLKAFSPSYVQEKRAENAALLQGITSPAFAATADPVLDAYARQSFLDNGLRGGFPRTIPGGRTLYLFGRKHGDLERDYNDFLVQDGLWSEGNGDFRDMLQNRRVDLFYNPAVGGRNIKYFFSLIQADGYNPLVLRNSRFSVTDWSALEKLWKERHLSGDARQKLARPFKFAALWECVKDSKDPAGAAAAVLNATEEVEDAEFEKGYWSDHWTYLVDMLENFRGVFPDRVSALLLDETYPFYDGAHFVQPRSRKSVLTERGARQYGAVSFNKEKDRLIKSRDAYPHRARAAQGKGEPVLTTLAGKILTLIANKLASLDPSGAGIEMEADRPGWCDAMNGLPSLFGSASNETYELRRLVRFARESLAAAGAGISLPTEIAALIAALQRSLNGGAWQNDPLRFWEETHHAKESYRESVFFGFDGEKTSISLPDLLAFLDAAEKALAKACERCRRGDEVVTYFIHHAAAHEALEEKPFVRVTAFKREDVPLFLEGFVHAFRTVENPEQARALHLAAGKTELYDKALGMYRLNVPLGQDRFELGRVGIFSYGWLENGSIFLHMHYKYVFELARRGLLDEFYKNWKKYLVPFRDTKQYRRSVLENTSFIASSGYKDKEDHGKAFVARLSGSTVEFMHMWSFLLFGENPYRLEGKSLSLAFDPSLKASLFTAKARTVHPDGPAGAPLELPKNALAFRFLGRALVVYHNPSKKDTFGPGAVRPARHELTYADGRKTTVDASTLPAQAALDVREGRVERIDVTLA